MPKADDWTIESWRREPRGRRLEFNEFSEPIQAAPPLWKDLTVASAIAILLWAAAVVVFG